MVLPDEFRPVNLDDAAARQPADAERDVEPERAGRDRFDLDDLLVRPEPHDGAFAEAALDLRDRRFQRLLSIHLSSFDQAQCDIRHEDSPLFHSPTGLANGGLDASPLLASQASAAATLARWLNQQCTCFVLSSQYVLLAATKMAASRRATKLRGARKRDPAAISLRRIRLEHAAVRFEIGLDAGGKLGMRGNSGIEQRIVARARNALPRCTLRRRGIAAPVTKNRPDLRGDRS